MIGQLGGDHYCNILEAKYKKSNLKQELASAYKHLTKAQRCKLLQLLTNCEPLFDDTLGTWKGLEYNIELKEGSTP